MINATLAERESFIRELAQHDVFKGVGDDDAVFQEFLNRWEEILGKPEEWPKSLAYEKMPDDM